MLFLRNFYHAQDNRAVHHVHGLVGDCFGLGLVAGLHFVLAKTSVAVFGLDSECVLRVVHLGNTIPQNLKKSTLFLKKVSVLVHSAL